MIVFDATILKFGRQGEKTGWTYIPIPATTAEKIKPSQKTSFRVSGKLDDVEIHSVALLPMGEGDFILPLKADLRKKLRKQNGDTVSLRLRADEHAPPLSTDLLLCLEDEPAARAFFDSLPGSHKRYYSNWVDSAKTELTRSRRIASVLHAFIHGMSFAEMLQWAREQKDSFR